jgi:hypothetical protein
VRKQSVALGVRMRDRDPHNADDRGTRPVRRLRVGVEARGSERRSTVVEV